MVRVVFYTQPGVTLDPRHRHEARTGRSTSGRQGARVGLVSNPTDRHRCDAPGGLPPAKSCHSEGGLRIMRHKHSPCMQKTLPPASHTTSTPRVVLALCDTYSPSCRKHEISYEISTKSSVDAVLAHLQTQKKSEPLILGSIYRTPSATALVTNTWQKS